MCDLYDDPARVTIIRRVMPENTLSVEEFLCPFQSIAHELKSRTGVNLEEFFIEPILHDSGTSKGGQFTVYANEEDEYYTYRILIDSWDIAPGYYVSEDEMINQD